MIVLIKGQDERRVKMKILSSLTQLAQHHTLYWSINMCFFGHDKEDPHAHVGYFNKITSTLKFSNVPNTSIYLMLFPFSLEGAAWIWLEKEPPRSIFTWDDLVSKFINQFFPPSKTSNLCNEITNFQQRFDESFSEAWDRFKDLLQACSHHGFSKLHQLDTFYNALNFKDQDSLNSTAGGNFLDKMPCECLAIIESKSKVRYSRNKPVVAKVSTNTSTFGMSPDVAKLKDMVKALLLDKKSQSPALVKAVEESCVTCGGAHSYLNYNQGNTSYRPPMMSNQIRPPSFPPVPNNQNVQRNNQNRFIPNTNRGNNFNQGLVYRPSIFQPPAYHAPAYQDPAPQTQGVSKEDFLAYVKANDAIPPSTSFLPKVVENEPEATKDTVNPTNNGNTKDVQLSVVQSESPVLTSKLVTSPISEPVIAPIFKDMSFEISFADALILMPKFASTLKALIGNKEKLSEMARTLLNEHCSVVLLKKLPEKLGDLGKRPLLDDYKKRKKINDLQLIMCGDMFKDSNSYLESRGSIEDFVSFREMITSQLLYLKGSSFHFSADFVVVDFDAVPRVPLILGRSFLKTGRALIGVFEGELTLRVGKEAITFNLDQTSRYSANYSNMAAKRIDVIDMAYEEQEVLGFSDTISSSNPTPYYDLIVSTTSPTLTPFGNSDFLLEEVDAFLAIEDDPTSSKFYQPYLDHEGDILLLEAFLNDDPSPPPSQGNYLPKVRKELKIYKAKSDKSSVDEPPAVELKDLPLHIEYSFLEGDDKLPVIIAKDLSVEEMTALITILNPTQRRVNPKIHDVIKQEVIKLLEAGLIYPISDSPRVSPVHCVPKKGGFTVVENEDNELIPTRLVTGWRVCINYRKLNEATRNDHFPLPFMDQMLERLAGNQYYCFLDGFSGYFQIPIDPKDQEKTTFTAHMECLLIAACLLGYTRHISENSFQSCLSHLERMLKRCEDTNLCLNYEKSHFIVKEGIVLGHKISRKWIEVDRAKVDVITKLPHLKTVKLTEAPILIAMYWNMPFELMCDASNFAIGAFLGQRQDKHFRLIHYANFDAVPRVPLILGRSFLKTGRALIGVFKGNYLPKVREELKIYEAKSDKYSVDEPPAVELKDLPPHIEYLFLEGDDKLPIIIAKDLSVEEMTALITILKSHKRAIAWKLFDIKVQHQRRVNPKIHDVIKQEVIKLLEAGLIYPISDSLRVSPVHCVPKKGGFTVVENKDNELIPTRLVTGIVLGYKISKQEIEVDKAKVDVITKLPHLKTVKSLAEISKARWNDLVHSFEGPADTKENMIMDLKLEYQTFRAKPSESLSRTYTYYKTLLIELANDGVKLSKHEINVGFVNSLLEKWLTFSQGLRNVNHTQTLNLADIYESFVYKDNLIQRSQADPKIQKDYKAEYKKIKVKLALLEEEVSDDEEVTEVKVLMALADDELTVGKNHACNGKWIDITMRKVNILLFLDADADCLFVPASMGYDHEMVPKSKEFVERLNPDGKLPNFNTGRIPVRESQDVNKSLKPTETSTDPESSKDSEAESVTPLPPLKIF
nr:reverse transcriptase domain-containing protein [Tanacetum cinerariifolium]